ncbi:MAG TPA: 2Fe-2S iron-sulfur cluster-binding protein, partial [Candidatus Deferrimicrobiaceae bacterium]
MKSRDPMRASGATWTVPADLAPGATLLDALRDEGIAVPAECGGVGTCGLCAVRMPAAPEPSAADREHLS